MNFFSDSLPASQRARGYEAALRRYFSTIDTAVDVRAEPGTAEDFTAQLQFLRVGHLLGALHSSNSPHFLRAGRGSAEYDGFDFYFVSKGSISFTGREGTVELRAGEMGLRSASSPFDAQSEQFEMLALGLPSEMLRTSGMKRGTDTYKLESNSVLSSCLQALLRTTVARYSDLTPGEGIVLQASILDAVAYLGSGCKEPDPGPRHEDRLREVKAVAMRSISQASLNPEGLAREVGISLRTLHRLFSLSGTTFGGWLRDARLERCWRDLTEPSGPRSTVAAIAFGWGFSDLRTFNRAFAARYGVTPSVARRNSTTSLPSADAFELSAARSAT
jgi:AraC-like DNA-binding protein